MKNNPLRQLGMLGQSICGWFGERLLELGISIDKVTQQLEDEGVEKFSKPFDKLMETLAQRCPRHLMGES